MDGVISSLLVLLIADKNVLLNVSIICRIKGKQYIFKFCILVINQKIRPADNESLYLNIMLREFFQNG